MHHTTPLACLLLILTVISDATAENWPQWRGPDQNGVSRSTGFPTEWSEAKNIAWKIKLPGWGTSTPIVWQDQIFLTCDDDGTNLLICLNRSGKQLWRATIGKSAGNRNRKASGSNPSPVTDGKHVYAYYRSGDLACIDLQGELSWHINVQEANGRDHLGWDLATSPVLTSNGVVIAVMHQGPSYVIALEKASGRTLWKTARRVDAPGEARDSYTTPLVLGKAQSQTVAVLGGDYITGHAASSGQELWRSASLNPRGRGNWRSISSPVTAHGMVIAPYSRGSTLTAVKPVQGADGGPAKIAWDIDIAATDVPSPVAYDGNIYLCGDRGDVTSIDAETGKEVWTTRLPRNRYPFSASPVVAEGKLYATRENGTTYVLELAAEPKLVATNALRENTYATPVLVDGNIFLRTSDYLFCIGEVP